MPFLTDLDSRAAIKGSKDPLGITPVWIHFGRSVIGNLTLAGSSVRGYTTLLLAFHFIREIEDAEGTGGARTLELFLKFEQLAAYARLAAADDGAFRGVDRARKTLAEGRKVVLSAEARHQILGDQKVYGLWGLYTVPSRDSGLLERDETRLTPAAREFVEREYLPTLSRDGLKGAETILDLLRPKRAEVHLDGRHKRLAAALAKILGPDFSRAEREFYRRYLLFGGDNDPTGGRQRRLAELLAETPAGKDEPFSMDDVRALAKEARGRGRKDGEDWGVLADRLEAIGAVESVLAPAGAAFALLLARDGRPLEDVSLELKRAWGGPLQHVSREALAALTPALIDGAGDEEDAVRWIEIAGDLARGDFSALVRHLLDQNRSVMEKRNGAAPWVSVQAGRLDVRYQDEESDLPAREDLPRLFVNPYFLPALRNVVDAIGVG